VPASHFVVWDTHLIDALGRFRHPALFGAAMAK
jgi:hypothetical protein